MKSGIPGKLKVVLDANVVISAPLSKDGNPAMIFELLLLEEVINFTSDEIIGEIRDVFSRDKIKKLISQEKVNFILENYLIFSVFIQPGTTLHMIQRDDDDNRILECAESAKVDYIVTGDEHLLALRNFKDIRIVSPKEFLQIYQGFQRK